MQKNFKLHFYVKKNKSARYKAFFKLQTGKLWLSLNTISDFKADAATGRDYK